MNSEVEEKLQKMMLKNIFSEVEKIRRIHDLDYMDSVLYYCESNNIDVELAGNAIRNDPVLMAKVQEEAESLNFIEKISRLPI
jgi:hypothetical protein